MRSLSWCGAGLAVVLGLGVGSAGAQQPPATGGRAAAPGVAASAPVTGPAAKPAATPAQAEAAARARASAQARLVDINSARKADLLKLPAMTPEIADKLIAGRPYGSKMHLVTRQVMPPEVFDAMRSQIIARQPYRSEAKNVEALKKAGSLKP